MGDAYTLISGGTQIVRFSRKLNLFLRFYIIAPDLSLSFIEINLLIKHKLNYSAISIEILKLISK